MSKHTPGPWEWDGPVWQYDSDNEAPWLVQAPWSDAASQTILQGEIRCSSEADARLIAAAPELLDALIAMLEIHGVTQAYADKHIEIPQSWVESSDLARAAIAKATGSQS